MLGLGTIKDILGILQSKDSPNQVAAGAALGMLLGFTPIFGLQNVLLLFILFIININMGAAFLASALFALLAYFLDPLGHKLGYMLLVQTDALTPLWTKLYNLPIVPFTHFNNTVVLGDTIIALAAWLPCFFGVRWLVLYYRKHWQTKVEKLGFMKWLKVSSIIDNKIK